MPRHGVLLFALSLFLVACSGTGTVPTDPALDGGPLSPPTRVVGRLYLGVHVSGASFRIEGLDGSVLATGTTGENGYVFFENLSLPANFRAVAQVPGSDVSFSAQLRAFDPTNRQVHISILSTLASELMQARPELSLPEAEGLVKRALRLPDALQLGLSLGEPNPVFSSIAFWRETGAHGGWNAYKQELLALFNNLQAQKGVSPIHFWLSLDQLDRPITGLEPGLNAVAEHARLRLADRYRVKQASAAGARVFYGPPLILLEGPTSLGGQFLLGVTTGLGGNLLSAGLKGVLGWGTNQMGLNYGTSSQLQEISEQLTAVEGALTQLDSEITDSEVINKITNLESAFNPVLEINISTGLASGATSSLINNLNSTLKAIQEGTLTLNTPQAVDISDLISTLETPDYPTILGDAEQQLPGNAGILAGVQEIVLNQQLGLDQPANFQRFPWRHNRVLDRILPVFQEFSTLQSATLNLEAEVAHNFVKYPDPVDGINAATPDFVANIASQKTQRQVLPFRSGLEGIITDHEYGIMWFDTVFHPVSYDSANSAATTATEQVILCDSTVRVYDDWRLPTYGEYQALQARGTYNPTYSQTTDLDRDGNTNNDPDDDVPVNSRDNYPDTGQSTAGLPGLGFYNVANALNAAPNDNGSNGDLWMSYYEADYSGAEWFTYHDDSYEFRLNHSSNNTSKESKSSDTNCYLMCRTFGPSMLVTPYADISDLDAAPDGPPDPSEVAGQPFVPAEYGQYGIPTSIAFIEPVAARPVSIVSSSTGATETYTPPPGSLQFQAQVTYTIHLGGDFTLGYGSGRTRSVSTPASSSSGTVWSYFESSGASYNGVKELINWSVANADASDLTPNATMLNAPYVGGILTPLAAGPVVVTARLLTGDLSAVSGTQTYTVNPAQRTLTGLQISPRNQLYGATQTQPAQGSYQYYCTGFYSDGTIESLAGLVTWSVSPIPNAANAQFVGSTLELSQPGQANPVSYNLTITASYQGQTDSTTIQIQPPVSPP
jgi:hypothetical protein